MNENCGSCGDGSRWMGQNRGMGMNRTGGMNRMGQRGSCMENTDGNRRGGCGFRRCGEMENRMDRSTQGCGEETEREGCGCMKEKREGTEREGCGCMQERRGEREREGCGCMKERDEKEKREGCREERTGCGCGMERSGENCMQRGSAEMERRSENCMQRGYGGMERRSQGNMQRGQGCMQRGGNRMNRRGHGCVQKSSCDMDCFSMMQEWDPCCREEKPVDEMDPGMGYIPWQKFENVLCAEEGFVHGTIFKDLILPFYGRPIDGMGGNATCNRTKKN